MVILVLFLYAVIVMFEFVPLYKQKLWKDFWVNMVLCIFSLTYAILLSLGVKIPSPAIPIQNVIISLFGK